MSNMNAFLRDRRGTAVVEYALVISLIAVVIVASLALVGEKGVQTFMRIDQTIQRSFLSQPGEGGAPSPGAPELPGGDGDTGGGSTQPGEPGGNDPANPGSGDVGGPGGGVRPLPKEEGAKPRRNLSRQPTAAASLLAVRLAPPRS